MTATSASLAPGTDASGRPVSREPCAAATGAAATDRATPGSAGDDDAECRGAAPGPAVPARRGDWRVELPLRHLGSRTVTVRAECAGPPGAPVVVAAGGISAGRHAAANAADPDPGWWEAQVGPGRPLDTTHWQVLAMDWVGADGTLDGPVDAADQAAALAYAADQFGLGRIAAFVGSSYGAMTGLHFAAAHADRLDLLVVISGAHRPHPFASALRAVQRQIVDLGAAGGRPDDGLALARQLAMLTYRTPREFAARFAAGVRLVDGHARAASADYLAHCGARYVRRTTPAAFRCLSESIDLHDIDPATVRTRTVAVAVAEDQLVPEPLVAELAERLAGPVRYSVISSLTGHDAFLTEPDKIGAILRAALPGGPA